MRSFMLALLAGADDAPAAPAHWSMMPCMMMPMRFSLMNE